MKNDLRFIEPTITSETLEKSFVSGGSCRIRTHDIFGVNEDRALVQEVDQETFDKCWPATGGADARP